MSPEDTDRDDSPLEGSKDVGRRLEEDGGLGRELLANIYLHYALDLWGHQSRNRHANGYRILVRYADDFVVGCEHRRDAERFLEDLRERMRKFGLELHPEKTRWIEFGRFAAKDRIDRGDGPPESFDFLGFPHVCARSRKGGFQLIRRTMKKRMRAKLAGIKTILRERMHAPVRRVGRWPGKVLHGHYEHNAVPGNHASLEQFRYWVLKCWRQVLRRRSQRSRIVWDRFGLLVERMLPQPRIRHPWPSRALLVSTRGRNPVREFRSLGSVREAPSDGRPYSEPPPSPWFCCRPPPARLRPCRGLAGSGQL